MPSEKKIEAYRKRLAKISAKKDPGAHLTRECLYAVVTYYDPETEATVKATLTGYAYRIGEGLFGPRVMLDVTLCGGCVHRPGGNFCGGDNEYTIENVALLAIERNEEQI